MFQLQTKRGSLIVAALISYHMKDRPTVLFSHGNAVDLALMLPFYRCAHAAPAAHCNGDSVLGEVTSQAWCPTP